MWRNVLLLSSVATLLTLRAPGLATAQDASGTLTTPDFSNPAGVVTFIVAYIVAPALTAVIKRKAPTLRKWLVPWTTIGLGSALAGLATLLLTLAGTPEPFGLGGWGGFLVGGILSAAGIGVRQLLVETTGQADAKRAKQNVAKVVGRKPVLP